MSVSNKVQRTHRLTRDDFIKLLNETDYKLLFRLNETSFGFEKFLQRREYLTARETIDTELVEIIIEISSRVCTIRQQNITGSIQKYLGMLAKCERFIFGDVLQVINNSLEHKQKFCLASYTKNYLIILKTMMKFDIGTRQICDYIFPTLQNVLNTMKGLRIKNFQDTESEYEKLKGEISKFEQVFPDSDENDDESGMFRQLPIVPTDNDVVNVILPDLPCNKTDGPYKGVESYLSVHFRLMREDMLRSFRDTIKMCENPKEAHKSGCLLYESVNVKVPPRYTPDGICYPIHVRTNYEINLAKKGVLMVGNMVCLTKDNFNTVHFAVLTEKPHSNKNITKECRTEIRLEGTSDDVLQNNIEYFMIETSAYFECYKHILAAIKEFRKNNFPLSDFLVFLDYDQPEPQYLMCPDDKIGDYCLHEKCDRLSQKSSSTDPITMDVKLLNTSDLKEEVFLQSEDKFKAVEVSEKDKFGEVAKVNSAEQNSKIKSDEDVAVDDCIRFNPLCPDEWPSATDMGLDDHQMEAFKLALTKKVAVIQGPPGTGKTFIGFKVVKALLENIPMKLKPIVVCCVTNRALDQFLKGILKFDKKVVRLGSQSQCDKLEAHTLENLYMACKKSCDKQTHLLADGMLKKSLNLLQSFAPNLLNKNDSVDFDELYFEISETCKKLNLRLGKLNTCTMKYLDDSALNKIIHQNEKEQLRDGSSKHSKILSESLLEWLCCSTASLLYEECNLRFRRLQRMNLEALLKGRKDNLWSLELSKRYALFYTWRINYIRKLKGKIKAIQEHYKQLKIRYSGRAPDFLKVSILEKASVIGVTTTGAAKYRSLIRSTNPAILIVEEAAEVLESHMIASLLPSTQHLILIGDHKQLRPLPTNHELSEVYNLKISMFERLFLNKAPSATLITQHRMKPTISDLLVQDELYTELKNAEKVQKYEEIRGVKSSVFFLDHSQTESELSTGTSSSNNYEAQMVASLTKYLCLQSYEAKKISILATYAAQIPLIQKYLEEENLDIKITTVDNYQGEENDIVLISFVRSNKTGIIGFLKENNRVNVALSRARKGMYCFGNFTLYAQKSPLWKCIVDKLKPQNMIGSKIPLQCYKHFKETLVESSEEILRLVQRGCSEKCGFELPCGHQCVRKCHSDDTDHSQYQCPLPCEKYIDGNKKCTRLCFERCKNIKKIKSFLDCGHRAKQKKDGSLILVCNEEVQKLLPCNHVDTLPCGTDKFTYKCKALVSTLLSCGHQKLVRCHKSEDLENVFCNAMETLLAPCGHSINVPCSLNLEDKELLALCKNSCGVLLKCGHECTGCCSTCSDNDIHALCTSKCRKILNCGHKCNGYCTSPCPPCKEKCSLLCSHRTMCINPCNRPCLKCQKDCERGCQHVGNCYKKCFELCSVEACSYTCREFLPCGHRCIGLCGDPCPYLCRVCNKKDLESGNPESDYYIELEECSHVIEANQLEEHIKMSINCFVWPDCPICKQPIRKSSRFKDALLIAKKQVLNSCDNSDEVDEVYYLLNNLWLADGVVPSEFVEINEKIIGVLNALKSSSGTLYVLKHCLLSLRSLIVINKKLKEKESTSKIPFLENRLETLLMWISNHLKHASYQQLDELDIQVKEFLNSFK